MRYIFEDEVAQHFKVSRRTVARWRERREIGYLQLPGQRVLYLPRHVEEFEQRSEQAVKRPRGRPRGSRKEL